MEGFNLMGKPVSCIRYNKGLEMIKYTGYFNSEIQGNMFAKLFKDYIELDATSYIIGNLNGETLNGNQSCVDEQLSKIDITSRYMILSAMLTD